MKYELTTNSIIKYGKTLYQIKALISFGSIKEGDFGGYIEKESNLDQSGNAWVSGNAMVSGNAWVSGNAMVSGNAWVYGNAMVYGNAEKIPIHIQGLTYPVTITDNHIKIGCEFHLIDEWVKFNNKEIGNMDGKKALSFWERNKDIILGLAIAHKEGK